MRTRSRDIAVTFFWSRRMKNIWTGNSTIATSAIQGFAYTMYPKVPMSIAPWNAGVERATPKYPPRSSTSPRIMATSCPVEVLFRWRSGKRRIRL